MATDYRRILDFLRDTFKGADLPPATRLAPREHPPAPRVPGGSALTDEAIAGRWALPGLQEVARETLADPWAVEHREAYARNIENFIGTAKVPIGLAGPLRVNGLHARGDFYIPLATTEAAVVASYSRGSLVVTEAGGCSALVLNEGVSRSPGFAFETLAEAGLFVAWVASAMDAFKAVARETTSRSARQSAADRRGQPRLHGPGVHHG